MSIPIRLDGGSLRVLEGYRVRHPSIRGPGFDVPGLMQQKNQRHQLKAVYCDSSVCESIEADTITNDNLLALDVDVLTPAALENAIIGAAVEAQGTHSYFNGHHPPEIALEIPPEVAPGVSLGRVTFCRRPSAGRRA